MIKGRHRWLRAAGAACRVTPITALAIAGAIPLFGPEFVLWLTDHRGLEA